MVKIKLFKGVLANPSLASDLASLPYDVVTRQEALTLANNKQHSFYHVIRPDIDLPEDIKEDDQQVYNLGKKNLINFLQEGYLQQDQEERLYAYQIEYMGIKSIGLFILASIQEYEQNIIKKHELTRKDKELDRTQIIDIQEANAEPILLTYPDSANINQMLAEISKQEPTIFAYTADDQASHKIWKFTTEQSLYIQERFKEEIPCFYIADGHHRTAASFNVATQRNQMKQQNNIQITGEEPYQYVLAFAMSFSNLKIMPYNRVIKSLQNKNEDEIFEQIAKNFNLRVLEEGDQVSPQQKGEWSLLIKKQWYRLTAKEDIKNQILGENQTLSQKLDVNILHHLLIDPIFDIKNIRTDKNIEFVGGMNAQQSLEDKIYKEQRACAILCYPVSINEFVQISDNHEIMSPKSTWFIPKPRSGLVSRIFG